MSSRRKPRRRPLLGTGQASGAGRPPGWPWAGRGRGTGRLEKTPGELLTSLVATTRVRWAPGTSSAVPAGPRGVSVEEPPVHQKGLSEARVTLCVTWEGTQLWGL